LITGHRGFNGEGCGVKLWDLRVFSEERSEPVFEFATNFSVMSSRFFSTPTVEMRTKIIGAVTADKKLIFLNFGGEKLQEINETDPFSIMAPLSNSKIVYATSKPSLKLFDLEETSLTLSLNITSDN